MILHAVKICFSLDLGRDFYFKFNCMDSLTAILIFWSQLGNHKEELFPGAVTFDT